MVDVGVKVVLDEIPSLRNRDEVLEREIEALKRLLDE